jgi:fumarate hydratase class II
MATTKGPIYLDQGANADGAFLRQLEEAVSELEERMKAFEPIQKGGNRVGYGVNKTQRGIAADRVISIVKAIKALKGW